MQSSRLLFFLIIGLALILVTGMLAARFFLGPDAPDEILAIGAEPVELFVLYSTEKEAWLEDVLADFDGKANGRPIELQMEKMGSREMYQAVLNGESEPDLISPASMLQIALLEDLSAAKYGTPFVNRADPNACRPVVSTPLVLVAWQERADVLWGDDPNGNMWKRLHDALIDPQGWESYGHPEWGYIKFGHTDPRTSNSGLMTVLLATYNYLGKVDTMTSEDILANQAYQTWLRELEGAVSEFGNSTGTYMREIITYGPSKYDIVAVYESTAIEQAENAIGRYGPLRVYYPPATVLSDHPFCVINADWVTSDEAEAGRVLTDYLLSRPAQEAALLQHGFRPVDETVALDQPGSPFISQQAAGLGLNIDLPPEVEIPPGDVLDTLLEFWSRNVAR